MIIWPFYCGIKMIRRWEYVLIQTNNHAAEQMHDRLRLDCFAFLYNPILHQLKCIIYTRIDNS